MSSTARLCTTLICSAILFLCQSKAIAFPTQAEIQPNDQNGSIYGYARKKEKSERQYTEVFHDDPLSNTLRVSYWSCLLYTSPSPRDKRQSRMPSSA